MVELWKKVLNTSGMYEVSNLGRVRSYKKGIHPKYLKPSKLHNGYLVVKISYKKNYSKTMRIHRLVMQSFVGENELLQVNHKDLNKENNMLDNLEYCTHIENIEHYKNSGKLKSALGENHGLSKLNNESVIFIKNNLKNRKQYIKYSKVFGVHYKTIYEVARGRSWRHVS